MHSVSTIISHKYLCLSRNFRKAVNLTGQSLLSLRLSQNPEIPVGRASPPDTLPRTLNFSNRGRVEYPGLNRPASRPPFFMRAMTMALWASLGLDSRLRRISLQAVPVSEKVH
jgi:hypothetical protein